MQIYIKKNGTNEYLQYDARPNLNPWDRWTWTTDITKAWYSGSERHAEERMGHTNTPSTPNGCDLHRVPGNARPLLRDEFPELTDRLKSGRFKSGLNTSNVSKPDDTVEASDG